MQDVQRSLLKAFSYNLYGFQVEREMCSASAEFEDFVLQFMDRYVGFGQDILKQKLLSVIQL